MRGALWVGLLAGCGRIGFPDNPDAAAIDVRASSCPVDPGLAACFDFDGDARDGTGHVTTELGAGIDFISGVHGLAAHFTPISALHVDETPVLDLTAITIEAWIFLDADVAPGTRMTIIDNNNQWGMFIKPNGTLACAGGTSDEIGGAIPTLTWTHAACVMDATSIAIYVTGGGKSNGGNTPIPTDNTNGSRIGGNLPDMQFPADDGLHGALDDLRIWSVTRTQAQVCAEPNAC